jgi:hypothetical protein
MPGSKLEPGVTRPAAALAEAERRANQALAARLLLVLAAIAEGVIAAGLGGRLLRPDRTASNLGVTMAPMGCMGPGSLLSKANSDSIETAGINFGRPFWRDFRGAFLAAEQIQCWRDPDWE